MGGILIPRAFLAALGQIRDGRFRTVLAKGLLLAILLLTALHVAVLSILLWILPDAVVLPWIGEISVPRQLVSWGSFLFMAVFSTSLVVPVAAAFTGIFLDEVADAVEASHYPSLHLASRIGLMETCAGPAKTVERQDGFTSPPAHAGSECAQHPAMPQSPLRSTNSSEKATSSGSQAVSPTSPIVVSNGTPGDGANPLASLQASRAAAALVILPSSR